MAKPTPPMVKLARIEERTRKIDGLRRLVFVVFCAAAGSIVIALALPQRAKLAEMEHRRDEAKFHETDVIADRDNERVEYKAIQEDPAFLEVHARDRLGRYEPGEKVLKFRKSR